MNQPSKLFRAYERGGDDISMSGLAFFYVSVFDHWLTEEEAEVCEIFTYKQAKEFGKLQLYEAGERSFLSLYRSLARSSNVIPHPEFAAVTSAEDLETIFIRSLREQSLMDICFENFNLRVVGGFDRTDLFIFGDSVHMSRVEQMAKDGGLYVLR